MPVSKTPQQSSTQKTDQPVSNRPAKTIKLTAIQSALSNGDLSAEKKTLPAESKNENKEFTADQLKAVWMQFAETKKPYQAEYQLLTQPVEVNGTTITLSLHHPVQETLLHNLRSDLVAYLRTQLGNQNILVAGKMRAVEDRVILYTNREKFEYLQKKNPHIKELKERLGLDTDF